MKDLSLVIMKAQLNLCTAAMEALRLQMFISS